MTHASSPWLHPGTDAHSHGADDPAVLDLLRCEAVAEACGLSGGELDLPLLYEAGPRIYFNASALPRALVVHEARIVADPAERLQALLDPAFDPRREVLLSRAPSAFPAGGQGAPGAADRTRVVFEEPGQITVEVGLQREGYLVLADSDYPGWRTLVNGEPAEILTANHAFRAVALGPGRHQVTFVYAPLSFRAGAWLTAAATALLAVVGSAALRAARQGKAEQP